MINEGDSRLHQGVNAEEILRRSRRGEITPYMVRVTGVREVQAAWREHVHAVLWDALTSTQQHAWEDIVGGFNIVTGVMHARAMDYSSNRGKGTVDTDDLEAARADYLAWANLVRHRKMKFDMILNMIAGGMSVREASRKAAPPTTNHFARLALIAALDIYSEIRGWR